MSTVGNEYCIRIRFFPNSLQHLEMSDEILRYHYHDVMMASQITGISMVCSTFCSGADQRKALRHGLCEGNSPVTGDFPVQRSSNAENVSI